MNENFDIIRLTRDNDILINKLLDTAATIHQRLRDREEWLKWKYFDSPFGECICLLAIKDGEIAGEVTFGKYEFLINGIVKKCLISYQTMVHPDHQKKGLFSSLTKQVLAIGKKEGIKGVFNFPNKASYIPFERLNFSPINHLKNYVHIANKLNLIVTPLSLKKPFFADSILGINKDELSIYEELQHSIKTINSKDVLVPNRTKEYLKWRYFSYPLYAYRIIQTNLGWGIIRTGNRGNLTEVQIMEVFPNAEYNKEFVRALKKRIKKSINPDLILFNISETHPLNKPVKLSGFLSFPHNISFFTYALQTEFEAFLYKEKWILTATEFHRY